MYKYRPICLPFLVNLTMCVCVRARAQVRARASAVHVHVRIRVLVCSCVYDDVTYDWGVDDPQDTVRICDGEIRGPNMVVTITRTFDDTLYSAVVKAKLADVFKEADANNDGKLTYDEWESRMGKLMPADELKRLFQECDTDKNGSLDTEEFAAGLVGKYEIQWAQVSI